MENLEISGVLDQVADLLEIKGANPFRVRAYRNAARTVRELRPPLRVLVEKEEDLTSLSGIGKEMAQHIQELVERGELGLLEELAGEVPRTLLEIIRLDGVGPKKARRLWKELGVTSVGELEEAVHGGRVAELEGFGRKSAERVLRAIESFRRMQGRTLLSDVDATVTPLLEHVRSIPGVTRVEVVGSYRRRRDTVGDLDLLVLHEGGSGGEVLDEVMAFSGVARVEAVGESEGRAILRSGLPLDVQIVPGASFGSALQHFTGSEEHNAALRSLGLRQGLRIDEHGVWKVPASGAGAGMGEGGVAEEARSGAVGSEEDVYRALGLPWISPFLREGRGELEAAREGRLPSLVSLADIRGDLQMHSTWSDGKNTLREMVEACRDRGYEYLSITDHSRAVTVAGGLDPERVRAQWEEIDEVCEAVEGIRLFRSLEVDILKDGSLDMPDVILEELDLVLISVHSFMSMTETEMTARVLRALEHPEVDILAHPTGRILGRREAYALNVDAVLEAARDLDVAVELNAHPSRLDLNDRHVRTAKGLGVKVAINTDAHATGDLAYMGYGVDQGRRGWLERRDVLNALPLEELEAWMRRRDRT